MANENQTHEVRQARVKIECDNISKAFHVPGQKQLLHVLDRVSLKVYENEFLVILGPGQSGKTVLLNCIAGLIEPNAGETRIDGRPITGPGPDRGMVFQRYALFPWKTVEHNVAFGLAVRGVPLKERLRIAAEDARKAKEKLKEDRLKGTLYEKRKKNPGGRSTPKKR